MDRDRVRLARYRDLMLAMVRVGVLGYGGGPSVVPLFRYEAVTRSHWVEDEEFGEILALANALPGPIATKMAAYLGYRVIGPAGAGLAVMAHILPTCLATVLLVGAFQRLQHYRAFQDMISAVLPVITVMLGFMTYEFAAKTKRGLGWIVGTATAGTAFLLLSVFHVNPGLVVAMFLAYGSVHPKLQSKWSHSSFAP